MVGGITLGLLTGVKLIGGLVLQNSLQKFENQFFVFIGGALQAVASAFDDVQMNVEVGFGAEFFQVL